MVTQAQFDADPYVRREVVTAELDWLGDELCRRTGRPRDAAGTKGDRHHLRGSHRSQDFIKRSALCTSRTYTAQSGLTAAQERHVAGFDFTSGSDTAMIAQCQRIYNAMRAGRLDEVREFYGNINGDQVVDGWNNLEDRNASSDSSHLWHWHLSLDRRQCTNRALMERIVAIALGEEEEDDVDQTTFNKLMDTYAERLSGLQGTSDAQKRLRRNWVAMVGVNELGAAVDQVDDRVRDLFGEADLTAAQKAALLRPVLGDDAAAVGSLLALA